MRHEPSIFGDLKTHDFHTHTTWSDGDASYLEMIAAAKKIGLKHLVITDHSDAVAELFDFININPDRKLVMENYEKDQDITVNFSVEADILNEKGDLCFTYDGVEGKGVVASLHKKVYEHFGGDLNLATDAYVNAIKRHGDRIDVIGHLTVPKIDLSKLDIEKIAHYMNQFEVKAEIDGKYVTREMNDDLSRSSTKLLLEKVDQVVFDSDAHCVEGLYSNRNLAFEYAQSLGFFTSVTSLGK